MNAVMVRILGLISPLTTVRSGRFASVPCFGGAALCCALPAAAKPKSTVVNSNEFLRQENEWHMTNLP
jgi:hypothetical protein